MALIMTVDDDPMIQELYDAALTIAGHRVVAQAFDGARAIEVFRRLETRPDIVILDHRMPVVSGLDAGRAMREIEPQVRILFVSADTSVREAALRAGAAGFLAKPFGLSELRALLDGMLGLSDPARPPGATASAPPA